MRTVKISVTRTIQVDRFEPVTVTVEESIQLKDSEDPVEPRRELYKEVTQQVAKYIENEKRKYSKSKKEEE
jgi:hypothetical protein